MLVDPIGTKFSSSSRIAKRARSQCFTAGHPSWVASYVTSAINSASTFVKSPFKKSDKVRFTLYYQLSTHQLSLLFVLKCAYSAMNVAHFVNSFSCANDLPKLLKKCFSAFHSYFFLPKLFIYLFSLNVDDHLILSILIIDNSFYIYFDPQSFIFMRLNKFLSYKTFNGKF